MFYPKSKHSLPERHESTVLFGFILNEELYDVSVGKYFFFLLFLAVLNGSDEEVVDEGVIAVDIRINLS